MCYICEEIKKYIYLKTKIKLNNNEKMKSVSRALLAAICVSVMSLGAQSKIFWQLGEADGSARGSLLNHGR